MWTEKKRGSTFVVITLEKHIRFFLLFLHCCKQEETLQTQVKKYVHLT